ncbi:MAG: GDYXXLXY domain-containing protein [Candidatus Omnitrophica bacterium]|nr:GDYXXLXY domain-containing protein [Candidatus Omnitrophota bacterium]MDD5311053.1 GDYXXLXY domain-containing protein [Candidatus Omnitrophota bacterium]
MSQKLKFYIVVAMQISFILGMVIFHQLTIVSGQKIFLKATPVDPLDLFRGYYAHINYDISRVLISQINIDREDLRNGEYIYAILTKNPEEKFYKVSAISHKKPSLKASEVIVRGRIQYFHNKTTSKIWMQTEEGKVREREEPWKSYLRPGDEVVIFLAEDGQIRYVSRKEKNFVPPKNQKVEYGKVIRIEEKKDMELNIKYGIESYFAKETKTLEISRARREADLYAEISLSKEGRALISRIFLNGEPL